MGSCGCARPRDAKRYLEKYKRLDVAIDAYYTNPNGLPAERSSASTTKINQLFDQYKGARRLGLPAVCASAERVVWQIRTRRMVKI